MKAPLYLLLALALLEAGRVRAENSAGQPGPSAPSVQLRQWIDATLPKITDISSPKQEPIDRAPFIEALADYSAKAQVASRAQQPMYQAAGNVIRNLLGAIEEHDKAAAAYAYSTDHHGKQDREDAKISSPRRGWDAGAAGRGDNDKQKMENADTRKALLDKEQFMSNGNAAAWARRVGQLQQIVVQSYSAELAAERQVGMLKPAVPPLVPVPKAAASPAETTVSDKYSPLGAWQATKGSWMLNDDGSFTNERGLKGTWRWGDRTRHELDLLWNSGGLGKAAFSADGQTLQVTKPNGDTTTLTR